MPGSGAAPAPGKGHCGHGTAYGAAAFRGATNRRQGDLPPVFAPFCDPVDQVARFSSMSLTTPAHSAGEVV